jgi:hypothetical protein
MMGATVSAVIVFLLIAWLTQWLAGRYGPLASV